MRTLACPGLVSRAELGSARGVKPKGAQCVPGEPALVITQKKQWQESRPFGKAKILSLTSLRRQAGVRQGDTWMGF